jgi:hypothetical protein
VKENVFVVLLIILTIELDLEMNSSFDISPGRILFQDFMAWLYAEHGSHKHRFPREELPLLFYFCEEYFGQHGQHGHEGQGFLQQGLTQQTIKVVITIKADTPIEL